MTISIIILYEMKNWQKFKLANGANLILANGGATNFAKIMVDRYNYMCRTTPALWTGICVSLR